MTSLNRFKKPDPRSLPVAILLTMLVGFGPISTDMYLASLPDLARVFNVSAVKAQSTLSVFLVGFACAMLIYGPLSDRFGRRPVMLVGCVLYVLASVVCVIAPTIEVLIAARFVQALGACAGAVIGRAVVRDVYGRDEAARMLSFMAAAMSLGPFAAPILGGWLHAMFGWQSNFIVLTGFGLLLLLGVYFLLAETNAHKDRDALAPSRMWLTYKTLLSDRQVLAYTATVSLTFAGMFAFISASSFVLIDVLKLPPAMFGLGFAVVIAGYIVGAFMAGKHTARLGLNPMIRIGTWGCAGAGLLALALALGGVTHMAAVLLPIMVYFMFAAMVQPNSIAGAMGPYPRMAGAASALAGFAQQAIGSGIGWSHAFMFDNTTHPLGFLLAFGGCAAALAFWLLLPKRN